MDKTLARLAAMMGEMHSRMLGNISRAVRSSGAARQQGVGSNVARGHIAARAARTKRPRKVIPAPPRRGIIIARAASALLDRPDNAVGVKVQQLENSMNQEESNSPADPERETRALSAAIGNVEKVTEVKDEFSRAGAERQPRPYPLTPEDAERVGRELAKRILAFTAAHRA